MRPHRFTKFTSDFAQKHVFSRQHATIPYFVSHNLNCEPSLHYFPCSNSRDCLAMYPLCWSVSVSFFGLFVVFCTTAPAHAVCHFSRVLRDSTTRFVGQSVRPSIRRSVTLYFFICFFFCGFWPHCSCPNDKATSNMAPANPHAT